MLHGLAEGVDGVLVVSGSSMLRAATALSLHHGQVGDVDGMVAAILPRIKRHGRDQRLRCFAPDEAGLARGKRGTKTDIVAVLGLCRQTWTANTGNAGELPLEPSYVVDSSPATSNQLVV